MSRKMKKPATTVSATASSGVRYRTRRLICGRASILSDMGDTSLVARHMLVHAVQAAHQQADLVERGLRRSQRPGQHADVDHGEAVGEREQLVEVLRDHEDGSTRARQLEQGFVDG